MITYEGQMQKKQKTKKAHTHQKPNNNFKKITNTGIGKK